jgi:hypothetical protein
MEHRFSGRFVPRAPRGWLAAAAALAATLAACGSGTPETATSPSTAPTTPPSTTGSAPGATAATTAPSSLPAAGTYADGATDVPHYVLVLSVGPGAALDGTLNFVYQDGRTATQFTFTGTAGAGTATLTSHGGGPGPMSATWSAGKFVLSGCTAYLQYAMSAAACTFSTGSGG